jgi:serine/threonine-protein kinase
MDQERAELDFGTDDEPRSAGELDPGATLGEYVVRAHIARGGCGSVYDAQHVTLARRVAVKVLHARLATQPKMVERFLREVELVNLLRHPGIVEIYEVGVLADRRPFYAMEYLPGGTLDELLRAKGRLTPEEALDVLEPVCAALQAAHAAGVVHRDVKASNIAFDEGRRKVVLLDFGIAKLVAPDPGHPGLTTVGRRLGTPTIMAPEQLLGGHVDARVDVYALGALLHRLLTGRPPFEGKTPGALARQHLEEPAPRPSRVAAVSPAVDAVVLRCLEKRPEHRFDGPRGMIEALAEALGRPSGGPTGARSAPGVAIYVDVHFGTVDDTLDDALGDDLGAVLDLAEAHLRRLGFSLAQVTGSGVLGVRAALDGDGDGAAQRREALAAASSLREALTARLTADPRVHANVVVHAGEVVVRPPPRLEIVGGALLRTAAWAPRDALPGVAATAAAVEGLDARELGGAPGAPLTILRAPSSG